ncbi:quaternary amine ABC transporter ATP-binding protein [Pelagibaculum spongiae]|uniref:Quaternary amine transport ATP-binding protein n=1 Tax=Pelagibaculum spongiae TaxID=2080658 RepID=A0A2V1GVJ0_9GAMM|nr:glycine betaine/L-proline ABC transporter ATP-binding protein [Pelagibaculum spongiae]PVZ70348.1 glycine betaine/L-proline ABC transporter ATP-binding protein [Pelagibaculum spongiae]
MIKPIIEIKNLYKLFGRKPESVMPLVHQGMGKDQVLEQTNHALGLKNINLSIQRGEIFVIMGLSGSGKSTLIRHLNRLIDPTEGQINIDGVDVTQLDAKQLQMFRRKKMSMVFQNFGLLPHKTVLDNVSYGLSIQGIPKLERNQKAMEWLESVGLPGYAKQYPSQLSGGQQQRVGLARALCTDAEILLMDEAFSALDPLIRSEMQDQLIELQQKLHKTIVFITHDLDEALRLGDRIAILKDGEIVQQGTPDQILLHPADEYVEAFVKDVNRARALTVETVMQPARCRITESTIEGALQQMRGLKRTYGYYVSDQGYQGVVTEVALCAAVKLGQPKTINDEIWQELPAIQPDDILESVIPGTLEAEYSVPVINKAGELKGELSRQNLAEAFSESKAS